MTAARYYMACLDLRGRSCLVVGGGRVALEKVARAARLRRPRDRRRAATSMTSCCGACRYASLRRAFRAERRRGPLPRRRGDRRPLREPRRLTRRGGARDRSATSPTIPSSATSSCPAIVRRDPIVVAVSTGGASPALAQRIRDEIADLIGPEHAELARRIAGAAAVGEAGAADVRGAARLLRGARRGGAPVTRRDRRRRPRRSRASSRCAGSS